MKNYRISYVIREGDHEYPFEIIRLASGMHKQLAIKIVTDHWLKDETADTKKHIREELAANDFAMLPEGYRAIQGITWQEPQPIIVTIRDGLVEGITHLPAGVCIEMHDWDSGEINTNGESVATVSAWEGPL